MIIRTLALTMALLAVISVATSPSSGEAPKPVGTPDTLSLGGPQGGTTSGSFLIHVSNSTQSLGLKANATSLQDNAGHQILASSISIIPSSSTVDINSFQTLKVTVMIPGNATPGNYSSRIVLLAGNGSTTTLSLSLTIRPKLSYYEWITVVIVGGVVLSFAYSPLFDHKPDKDKKHGKGKVEELAKDPQAYQAHLAYVARVDAFNKSRWTGLRTIDPETSKSKRDWGKIRNAVLAAGAAATLAAVAFAYFFSTATDFGAMCLRDFTTAFLQGFLVHRGLDGLAPKIFNTSNGKSKTAELASS